MNHITVYCLPYGTAYGYKPRYTTDAKLAREWSKSGYIVLQYQQI